MKALCLIISLCICGLSSRAQVLTTVRSIDSLIQPLQEDTVGNNDTFKPLNTSYHVVKKYIDKNKNLIRVNENEKNKDLSMIELRLSNPKYIKKQEKHSWGYYYFKDKLVLAFNTNVTDYGRVVGFNTFYFVGKKCIHKIGLQSKSISIESILENAIKFQRLFRETPNR